MRDREREREREGEGGGGRGGDTHDHCWSVSVRDTSKYHHYKTLRPNDVEHAQNDIRVSDSWYQYPVPTPLPSYSG